MNIGDVRSDGLTIRPTRNNTYKARLSFKLYPNNVKKICCMCLCYEEYPRSGDPNGLSTEVIAIL